MTKMIFAASTLALIACSASPEGDVTAVTTKRTNDDAVYPRTPPTLYGTITERMLGTSPGSALADVHACLLTSEAPLCVQSAGDGSYSVGPLLPHTTVRLLYATPGFVPALADYDVREHSLVADVALLADSLAGSIAAARGKAHVPGHSAGMVVAAWSIGLDGLTPLAGVSARSASVSLVFTDAANQLRPELTSTSSSAWGAAFGLDPGPVRLEFSHLDSGLRCGGIATNGTIETSVEVNLQAGGVTLLNVYCYV